MKRFNERLLKLERHTVKLDDQPQVIYLCNAEDGEPHTALFVGGGQLERDPDETIEAFDSRVDAYEIA
jgi:hypothetical protein